MTAEAFLVDANTRRQIMIQRLSNGVWEEIKPILGDMAGKIRERIRTADSELRRGQLALLLQDVQAALDEGKQEFDRLLRERVIEFAEDEAEFQKQTFEQITDSPVEPVPQDSITGEVMTAGVVLALAGGVAFNADFNQIVNRQFQQNAQDIQNTISTGYIGRRPPNEVSRDVDRKIGNRMTTQSRAVVATLMNHAANVSRTLFARANPNLVQNERYVAVLDARTTMRCAGLDGQIFVAGEGPQPPIHYNCRSIRVPIIRPEDVSQQFQGDRRAEGIGGQRQNVPAGTTFTAWLRDQPVEFRDEFFSKFTNGAEKRKLFDYGGLNPNDFIDPSGAQMSLSELQQKYPTAWQQANI
jgi:SPP1 gp7 family putative phage head morphogenesis protein